MFDLDKLQIAIDYIESNLHEDLSSGKVANRVGFSKFHFNRIFRDIFGVTITEYIRNRRLSLAANQLAAGKFRVIDAAYEAGFSSQSAFTRSFRKLFGVNPVDYAGHKPEVCCFPRADLNAYRYARDSEYQTDVTIVERPEVKLVGMGHETPTLKMLFYRDDMYLVHLFCGLIHTIKNIIAGEHEIYTVSTFSYGGETSTFFCAIEVSRFEDIPAGMESRTLPAKTFARFVHSGPITGRIHHTTDFFYLRWLPSSEWNLDFEEPDKKITIQHSSVRTTDRADSEIEILVPVKKRT
jgi:AraC family transcriptional regulator